MYIHETKYNLHINCGTNISSTFNTFSLNGLARIHSCKKRTFYDKLNINTYKAHKIINLNVIKLPLLSE